MATNNAINLNAAGIAGYNGSGTFAGSSLTQYQVQIGGSNAYTLAGVAVGTNGQVLLGSTGAAPVFATLGAGAGISYTTGAGSLTISATGGGLTWSVITANQTASANNGYFINKSGVLTLTLPTTTVVGQVIGVININTAADCNILSANPGQIQLGSSLCTANTGSLNSTALGDAVFLVAMNTTSSWYCYGVQGNWTIA